MSTDQILLNKSRSTYTRVIDLENMHDSKGTIQQGLCVYRDTPHSIHVQVRTATSKQGRISGLSISAAEAREIAEYLLRKADELTDDNYPAKKD